jgi:hypothetical protein
MCKPSNSISPWTPSVTVLLRLSRLNQSAARIAAAAGRIASVKSAGVQLTELSSDHPLPEGCREEVGAIAHG